MITMSVQVPEEMRANLKTQAKKAGLTPSKLVRTLIEVGLERRSAKLTLADKMSKLRGCISRGPKDLSRQKTFEE